MQCVFHTDQFVSRGREKKISKQMVLFVVNKSPVVCCQDIMIGLKKIKT